MHWLWPLLASYKDTSHQAIKPIEHNNQLIYDVIDDNWMGCNLCQITCPVTGCITMEPQPVNKPYLNWTQHPNNPMREVTTAEAE